MIYNDRIKEVKIFTIVAILILTAFFMVVNPTATSFAALEQGSIEAGKFNLMSFLEDNLHNLVITAVGFLVFMLLLFLRRKFADKKPKRSNKTKKPEKLTTLNKIRVLLLKPFKWTKHLSVGGLIIMKTIESTLFFVLRGAVLGLAVVSIAVINLKLQGIDKITPSVIGESFSPAKFNYQLFGWITVGLLIVVTLLLVVRVIKTMPKKVKKPKKKVKKMKQTKIPYKFISKVLTGISIIALIGIGIYLLISTGIVTNAVEPAKELMAPIKINSTQMLIGVSAIIAIILASQVVMIVKPRNIEKLVLEFNDILRNIEFSTNHEKDYRRLVNLYDEIAKSKKLNEESKKKIYSKVEELFERKIKDIDKNMKTKGEVNKSEKR